MNAADRLRLLRVQRDQIGTPGELRMVEVDARVDDGFFSVGQAEALKTLIATSDVPSVPA